MIKILYLKLTIMYSIKMQEDFYTPIWSEEVFKIETK